MIGGMPRSIARRCASAAFSAVIRLWYSATMPSIVALSHFAAVPFDTSPMSAASTPAAGLLDTPEDLRLHFQAADEPVEVGDDDHVHPPGLDRLDRAEQPGPLVQRLAAGDVHLLKRRPD
jgi:hypothetical protein